MASSSLPEPTVVFYKSSACRHCTALSNIWDTAASKEEDSVTGALKKVHPKLRFYVLTAKDNTGKFDENTAPKDLIRYGKWFPQVLLVPGKTWDAAMLKLGPKNDVELVDGVQIMNGFWDKGELKYQQKYDIRKPADFAKWLKDSFENEDFKRVQNGVAGSNGLVVPTGPAVGNPIQPLLTSIVRPSNTNTSYVAAGNTDRPSVLEGNTGDICSMRIISRPR
jgi:hypothetical protein